MPCCYIWFWFIIVERASSETLTLLVCRCCIRRHFVCAEIVWMITSMSMSILQGNACLYHIGGDNKIFISSVVTWIVQKLKSTINLFYFPLNTMDVHAFCSHLTSCSTLIKIYLYFPFQGINL